MESGFLLSITILVCLLVYVNGQDNHICSFYKCRCFTPSKDVYEADCSRLNITTIPTLPEYITSVNFSYNNIKTIQDGHFRNNSKLQSLDFSYNIIQTIRENGFKGLANVENLYLKNNHIVEIDENTFHHMTQLEYLDLKNNKINLATLNITLPASITTLKSDFKINGTKAGYLKELPKLKLLDISGLTGRCQIKVLTPETLNFAKSVEHLDISACGINLVFKGTFRSMSHLSNLDISLNTCLKFAGLKNITKDLSSTSIKVLKFNHIHRTYDMNTRLTKSHLDGLQHTNITEIHASRNRIQQIESGALLLLNRTIQTLYVSDNEFSFGYYLFELIALPIQFVNASNLFSSHSDETDINEACNFASVEKERICYNSEQKVDKSRYDKNNNLNSSEVLGFKNLKLPLLPLPPKLKTFLYRKNSLRSKISGFAIGNNSLEFLDLSFNVFYAWIGPILTFQDLKFLNLSYNLCANVSDNFFKSAPNLKYLHVQNNYLGFLLSQNDKNQILEHLPFLKIINLSENRIVCIPIYFFKNQKYLKHLILKGNMLQDLKFEISHMTHLSFLDLSNNKFSSFDSKAIKQLGSVSDSSNLTIDLSENTLHCTCTSIEFIQWFSDTNIKFTNQDNYTCKSENGRLLSLKNPKIVYEQLKKKCSNYTVLIITISLMLLVVIFIILWGLAYRHRWKIRYFYYMMKSRYHDSNKPYLESNEDTYQYDVFVSYENNDRFFVHEKLMPKLEDEGKLKLCIHKRDFLPGNYIAENITSAIHNSRKVVVIMSHTYIDSYWCMFEYNMAKVESIYSRNKENILFLVFLEQISPKDLPLVILELVQSQCYIEYPNDEYGDDIFWNNLQKVLS